MTGDRPQWSGSGRAPGTGRREVAATRGGATVVTATVPLAELFGYATRLRSRTQGRGTFTARPTGYAPAPVVTTVTTTR